MLFEKYGILGKQNKIDSYNYYFKMLLSKLNALFTWHNLPDTVDESFLNFNLFLLGYSAFFKIDDALYTNFGSIGGKYNENYYPTEFILSNPIQGGKNFKINSKDENCILMYNTESDKQFINFYGAGGMYRLLKQTATLLSDNLQSINTAQINSRVQTIISASTDKQKNSAEQIVKKMYNGDPYQILVSDEIQQITVQNVDTATSNIIETLLQVHQYILADFYNQIGIPTTPYQKKERLITDEIETLDKTNQCNIYTMCYSRKKALDRINDLFGTKMSVEISPWAKNTEDKSENTEDKSENIEEEEK